MADRTKILVVDDERFNIKVLSDLLKSEYKIMAAINGQQALKAARSDNPPSLILLDIMMPDMDGYEVLGELKSDEKTRGIPVVFVTGMESDGDKSKGLNLGAVDYLAKPISPELVLEAVRKYILS